VLFLLMALGDWKDIFVLCFIYKASSTKQNCVASSKLGIAALNVPTGRTAYSRFKLPVDNDPSNTCFAGKQTSLAQLLNEASLIIWDEMLMAHKHNIESLDAMLHDVCETEQSFGGKVIVFGGDFRQVPPVVPRKYSLKLLRQAWLAH